MIFEKLNPCQLKKCFSGNWAKIDLSIITPISINSSGNTYDVWCKSGGFIPASLEDLTKLYF